MFVAVHLTLPMCASSCGPLHAHACQALSLTWLHLPAYPQFGWVCYLPLALVCPPSIYLAHRTSNFVFSVGFCTPNKHERSSALVCRNALHSPSCISGQVFVHTELIGKLWWPVELMMNTPSHHRVHHARNYGRK